MRKRVIYREKPIFLKLAPSLNEVNYVAFGDASEEFHNELYGFLQEKASVEDDKNEKEKDFENWLFAKGCIKPKSWIRIYRGNAQPSYSTTLQTFIRNSIHHPENTQNPKYTADELKTSIIKMMDIAKTLSTNDKDEH